MKNDPVQIDRARALRYGLTFAETRLWNALKGQKLGGFKFRRQHLIGQYIVDFCCVSAKVVVELDGDAHLGRAYADRIRDEYLRSCGYEVIRFENCDTKYEEGLVLGRILSVCKCRVNLHEVEGTHAPHPLPLSSTGRGRKLPEHNSQFGSMHMVAVTIHDLVQGPNGGYLSFDLIDILHLIESDVVASTWRVGWVESIGGAYRIWDGHEFRPEQYSGTDLIRIAATARQIIWGDFEAYRNSEPTPWLVIRAIDSSFWVVISNESRIIEVMKSHFKVVRDSPNDAEYPEESHHSLSE